jgi:hypothetical protein
MFGRTNRQCSISEEDTPSHCSTVQAVNKPTHIKISQKCHLVLKTKKAEKKMEVEGDLEGESGSEAKPRRDGTIHVIVAEFQ